MIGRMEQQVAKNSLLLVVRPIRQANGNTRALTKNIIKPRKL
jgi:hypothetical protein